MNKFVKIHVIKKPVVIYSVWKYLINQNVENIKFLQKKFFVFINVLKKIIKLKIAIIMMVILLNVKLVKIHVIIN